MLFKRKNRDPHLNFTVGCYFSFRFIEPTLHSFQTALFASNVVSDLPVEP